MPNLIMEGGGGLETYKKWLSYMLTAPIVKLKPWKCSNISDLNYLYCWWQNQTSETRGLRARATINYVMTMIFFERTRGDFFLFLFCLEITLVRQYDDTIIIN